MLSRLSESAVAQGGRGLQADIRARVRAPQAEESLVVRLQRPVGKLERGHHLLAGRAMAAKPGRRRRELGDQFGQAGLAALGPPACGQLDRER